jgi:hypothetical protein
MKKMQLKNNLLLFIPGICAIFFKWEKSIFFTFIVSSLFLCRFPFSRLVKFDGKNLIKSDLLDFPYFNGLRIFLCGVDDMLV